MPTILESKDDFQNLILTDYERTLCHKLRTLLMDLPDDVFRSLNTLVERDHGEMWTDQMLLVYLQYSMGLMNAYPLQTGYELNNLPSAWESPLLLGAMIQAIWGISVQLNVENFSYSDNGLSLSLNTVGVSGIASGLMSSFDQQLKNLKYYLRPAPASFMGAAGGGVRLRSYSPRMWVYR